MLLSTYVDRLEEIKMGSSLGLDDRVSLHLRGSFSPVRGTIRNHCRFMSGENQSLAKPSISRWDCGGDADWVSRGDTAVWRLPGELFQLFRCGATRDWTGG